MYPSFEKVGGMDEIGKAGGVGWLEAVEGGRVVICRA